MKRKVGYEEEDEVVVARMGMASLNIGDGKNKMMDIE